MNTRNMKQYPLPIGRILLMLAVPLSALGLSRISLADGFEGPLAPLETVSPFFDGGAVIDSGYPFGGTTPAGSFAHGVADVIRARGDFNLATSEAAINATEARARAIVNAQEGVKAYFNIRQLNRDYRQAERGPRPTQEQYARYAQLGRPTPLSPSELNSLTGRVDWPILLEHDHFAPWREQMEELLDRWAVSRNMGPADGFRTEEHLAFRNTIAQMENELRKYVRDLPPQDYAAAKEFLRSLEYHVLELRDKSTTLAANR